MSRILFGYSYTSTLKNRCYTILDDYGCPKEYIKEKKITKEDETK